MNLCIFEDDQFGHLSPLSDTRPVYDLRIGRQRIWERLAGLWPADQIHLSCRPVLAGIAPDGMASAFVNQAEIPENTLYVNGRWLAANADVVSQVTSLAQRGEASSLVSNSVLIAAFSPEAIPQETFQEKLGNVPGVEVTVVLLDRLWQLVHGLEERLKEDLGGLEAKRAGNVSPLAILNGDQIIVEEGAQILPGAILNADHGPIMIARNAVVSEGALLRGPVYVGPGATINSGARLATVAIGPGCKIGGEVKGTVLYGNSNKAHDGYLGDSYVGQWCNLGASTDNSNLRNDYRPVDLYNRSSGTYESTGQTFMGLIMGDHSKCSIGTKFNTATVVGVFCNLYGAGFHPRHIESFTWGTPDRQVPYRIGKALEVARTVLKRRNRELGEAEEAMLTALYATAHPG